MTTVKCRCGACTLQIHAEPRARMLCHCTICQRFNNAPFADIAVFRREEAALVDGSPVEFHQYKKTMAVDRGACRECGQPVVEYLKLPLLPAMAFVPVAMLEGHMNLAPPTLRLFYERRVDDADDDLPRYSGFLASQLAASRTLLPALLR